MLSLRELQAGFAAALFNPGASSAAPGIRADGISPAVQARLLSHQRIRELPQGAARDLSGVENLVGTGFFASLAEEYTRRYPSRSGDVGRHGEQFPEFLRRHRLRARAALSRGCRAPGMVHRRELQRGRRTRRSTCERLAAVPRSSCERLRFLLAPSCRLLSSRFPVNRIWRDMSAGLRGRRAASIWTRAGSTCWSAARAST